MLAVDRMQLVQHHHILAFVAGIRQVGHMPVEVVEHTPLVVHTGTELRIEAAGYILDIAAVNSIAGRRVVLGSLVAAVG